MTSLNIDKILGKVRNRFHLIGIELEGGWKKLPEGVTLASDGSVNIRPDLPQPPRGRDFINPNDYTNAMLAYEKKARQSKLHIGELQSEPLEPVKLSAWMKHNYPSKVNESCGLHVHMSFRSAAHYGRLMIPEYQYTAFDYVARWAEIEKLGKDHPIWKRLSGKNEFCRNEFHADMQVLQNKKEYSRSDGSAGRYTGINYPHGLHGTIECRLLPMMETAEQGIRAVQHVLDITNACLVMTAKREEQLKADIPGDEVLVERRSINV